jgi:hypothetical protein
MIFRRLCEGVALASAGLGRKSACRSGVNAILRQIGNTQAPQSRSADSRAADHVPEIAVLKIFGSITWFLGIGGLIYTATTSGGSGGAAVGPAWIYSKY